MVSNAKQDGAKQRSRKAPELKLETVHQGRDGHSRHSRVIATALAIGRGAPSRRAGDLQPA